MNGKGVEKNVPRAAALLQTASQGGSAIATYDLGVLAQEGAAGKPAEALDYFRQSSTPRRSARLSGGGHPARRRARRSPRIRPPPPRNCCAASPATTARPFNQLTAKASSWSHDTIKAVQARLKSAGYYSGLVDGKGGAALAPALKQWRLLGPPTMRLKRRDIRSAPSVHVKFRRSTRISANRRFFVRRQFW